ncbi:metal-dependent hydrolase family protein [Flagellimonas crocea]|uniref:metal-dependent hydrolase family protein n=1 Tax=Flagellimonas crocea TaxID=3067311 RepID=UPI00296EAEB5|nr:amidohydrolase family protein [Muricauda sp. DH64]
MCKYYCTCLLLFFASVLYGQQSKTYIKAGVFYDSEQNKLLQNKLIVVENGSITDVLDASETKIAEHHWIDLSDHTVLPGLIDAHTHVLFSQAADVDFTEHSMAMLTTENDALRVLRGSKRAKSYLDVGITSIKDLGNSGLYLDVALRDAIDEGTIIGPRIFASGPILSAPGGQIYGVVPKHQDLISAEYRIIRGVEDAKLAVQEHVNQGVDLIKICSDNLPNKTLLSLEEMQAIVHTAHQYGLKVTAHSVTDESAKQAINAGVDGIEHGFNISDSILTMMAENDVFLVPTENSTDYMELYNKLAGYDQEDDQWIEGYRTAMTDRLQKALKIGVTIIAGSDNYTQINVPRGASSRDMLKAYYESGMAPLDILRASTYLSAQKLGKEHELGVLKKGAKADIIAIKGDIRTQFYESMENVVFVMKDGQVFKSVE